MVLIEARKRQIENEAIRLRWEVWNERARFWPGRQPHPVEVLDPQIAARVLGVDLEYFQELSFGLTQLKFETAGVLDRPKGKIAIAQCYGPEVALFTAAHELGHLLLHKEKVVLHRDLPISGLEQVPTDPIEREANYFAGTFLMPTEFLSKVFKASFGAAPFVFDEAAAHFLRPNAIASVLHPHPGSRERSVALASARSYAGRAFSNSLAQFFKVSVATMVIRLRELELVEDYP
jgi:hypothetical protein